MPQKLLKLIGAVLLAVLILALSLMMLGIETESRTLAAPNQQNLTRPVFWRFLDTNGDGTGNKNITGTYAITSEIFYLQPPAGSVFVVSRLIVNIEDDATVTAALYGAETITNGLGIRTQDNSGTLVDFTDGISITANGHWSRFCDLADITFGAGNEFVQARCDFSASGSHIRLNGDKSERLEVIVNDDFDGLVSHYIVAEGYTE